MPEQIMRHPMECDTDTYWRCVFDDEYSRRLYVEQLHFREFTVLEQKEDEARIHRKLRLNPPPADLPGPIQKVIGDLSWVEEATFDKKTQRYAFVITPASKPDRTHISGEVWCEPKGDKRVERCARLKVEVKIMLVGGLVEHRVFDDTRKSYEAAARFTGQYVREKGW